ncbi:MAG: exopolysaccharide biosynthesis polyprenyl glycosylphosphotransferase [Spirochaetales bacterium]|nr:exopolysaccharide biosynthesis polyprenyl glycosylphosphotransferase [Spirochaetales bacterium]
MDHLKDFKYFVLRMIADIMAVAAAWLVSYYLRFYVIPGGIGKPLDLFLRLGIIIIVLFIFFLNSNKLYSSMRNFTWIDESTSIVLAAFKAVLGFVIILYFFFPARVSRLTIFLFSITVVLFIISERIAVKNILLLLRKKGWNNKKLLLLGFGPALEKYIEPYKDPAYGIRIIGQFGADESHTIHEFKQYNGDLPEILEQLLPDIVVISYPESYFDISQKYIGQCYDRMSSLMVILDFQFPIIGSSTITQNGQHVLQVNHTTLTFFDRIIKRTFDIIFSLIGLIVLSPLFVLIGLLVKLTSRGPVFFAQKRVTEGDRVFRMFKFRTMKRDAVTSGNGTAAWTEENDSRITKLGKFLRRASLDELPQLLNVLIGNMSLIGPRPERPDLAKEFGKQIPGYRLRHKVKAGMSGWAQINGWRGNTSLPKRIESDLFYIQHWSLLLDIKIIFFTFIKGFVNKNAY